MLPLKYQPIQQQARRGRDDDEGAPSGHSIPYRYYSERPVMESRADPVIVGIRGRIALHKLRGSGVAQNGRQPVRRFPERALLDWW